MQPQACHKPPCQNLGEYPECIEYCSWHESLTKKWTKSKILRLLKYAIPQRMLAIKESVEEMTLAKELFGSNNAKGLSNTIVPTSSPIFCFRKNHGYSGDHINILDIKACNDFFSTPTDSPQFEGSWVYCKTDCDLKPRYLCFSKFGIFIADLAICKNCSPL